ncbi:MAG: hypothetical protein WCI92_00600 [Bacteroidota bacterium]
MEKQDKLNLKVDIDLSVSKKIVNFSLNNTMNNNYIHIKDEINKILTSNNSLKVRIEKLAQMGYVIIAKSDGYCWNYSTGDRKWTLVESSYEGAAFYAMSPYRLLDDLVEENMEYSYYFQISSTMGRFRHVKYTNCTYYAVVSEKELNQRLRKMKIKKIFK